MADAKFLTFEGLDGSGKSTHLRRAADWLRGRGDEVRVTHEPGGTPLGDAIRGLFLDDRWGEVDGRVEAMLVFASRRQHLVELVEPTLRSGVHVLCDRFTDSSLAYQGAGRGLGADWILELDRLATGDPHGDPHSDPHGDPQSGGRRPDATLLFDLEPEAAMERGQKGDRKGGDGPDRLDVEGLAFYRAVCGAYRDLAAAEPERFHVVDSGGEKEDTWREVEAVLETLFP